MDREAERKLEKAVAKELEHIYETDTGWFRGSFHLGSLPLIKDAADKIKAGDPEGLVTAPQYLLSWGKHEGIDSSGRNSIDLAVKLTGHSNPAVRKAALEDLAHERGWGMHGIAFTHNLSEVRAAIEALENDSDPEVRKVAEEVLKELRGGDEKEGRFTEFKKDLREFFKSNEGMPGYVPPWLGDFILDRLDKLTLSDSEIRLDIWDRTLGSLCIGPEYFDGAPEGNGVLKLHPEVARKAMPLFMRAKELTSHWITMSYSYPRAFRIIAVSHEFPGAIAELERIAKTKSKPDADTTEMEIAVAGLLELGERGNEQAKKALEGVGIDLVDKATEMMGKERNAYEEYVKKAAAEAKIKHITKEELPELVKKGDEAVIRLTQEYMDGKRLFGEIMPAFAQIKTPLAVSLIADAYKWSLKQKCGQKIEPVFLINEDGSKVTLNEGEVKEYESKEAMGLALKMMFGARDMSDHLGAMLARLDTKESLKPLVEQLGVNPAVAGYLAQNGGENAVVAMINVAVGPNYALVQKLEAIKVLGTKPEGVEFLAEYFHMAESPYLKCAALMGVTAAGDRRALDMAKALLEAEDVKPGKENRVEAKESGRTLAFTEVPAGSIKEVLHGPGPRVTMTVNDKDTALVKEEEVDSTHAFAIEMLFGMARNHSQPAIEALKQASENEKDEAVKGVAKRFCGVMEEERKTFNDEKAGEVVRETTERLEKPDNLRQVALDFGVGMAIMQKLGASPEILDVNTDHGVAALQLAIYAAHGNKSAMEELVKYAEKGECEKAKQIAAFTVEKFAPENAPFTRTVSEIAKKAEEPAKPPKVKVK